jgi:hypothetical protein
MRLVWARTVRLPLFSNDMGLTLNRRNAAILLAASAGHPEQHSELAATWTGKSVTEWP